jgi:CRISPR/Cas system CSM-associated protein Csm2 small subunit
MGRVKPALCVMKKYGVPIILYKRKDENIIPIEGELIFNLNVLEECVDKYNKMDDILNAFSNIKAAKVIGTLMWNEAAEIWNEEHEEKRPRISEKQLGRMLDTIEKINEFQQKVRQAMLSGLPQGQVEQVEELEKNLIAAQSSKMKKDSQR